MSDFTIAFIVLISIIGIMSIFALMIALQSAGEAARREKSGRFPAAVEISLGISETMALVRNTLLQKDFAGVRYSIADDNAVSGCTEAIATGVPSDGFSQQAIDISMLMYFTKVTDEVTRIERNFIVRSLIDEDVNRVVLATNAAFAKIASDLTHSPLSTGRLTESSAATSALPLSQILKDEIVASKAGPQTTISPAPASDFVPEAVFLPDPPSLPTSVIKPVTPDSLTSATEEDLASNTCSSCNYPLDAGFSFCLHCGKAPQ